MSASPMQAAIDAVPYAGSVKVGLQFKRRFWEEDEAIYGGISYTDLPIRQIGYPNTASIAPAAACCSGAYLFEGANSYEFTAMTPAERVTSAVEFGAKIHPQYKAEFENGVAVAWHRVPFTLGCAASGATTARARALPQSVPDRRADRAGRRACFRLAGVAGRRDPVLARRHRALARPRGENVMLRAVGPKRTAGLAMLLALSSASDGHSRRTMLQPAAPSAQASASSR